MHGSGLWQGQHCPIRSHDMHASSSSHDSIALLLNPVGVARWCCPMRLVWVLTPSGTHSNIPPSSLPPLVIDLGQLKGGVKVEGRCDQGLGWLVEHVDHGTTEEGCWCGVLACEDLEWRNSLEILMQVVLPDL